MVYADLQQSTTSSNVLKRKAGILLLLCVIHELVGPSDSIASKRRQVPLSVGYSGRLSKVMTGPMVRGGNSVPFCNKENVQKLLSSVSPSILTAFPAVIISSTQQPNKIEPGRRNLRLSEKLYPPMQLLVKRAFYKPSSGRALPYESRPTAGTPPRGTSSAADDRLPSSSVADDYSYLFETTGSVGGDDWAELPGGGGFGGTHGKTMRYGRR